MYSFPHKNMYFMFFNKNPSAQELEYAAMGTPQIYFSDLECVLTTI